MEVYKPLWTTDKTYIIIKSGRDAGKSKALSQLIFSKFFSLDRDIIVCRSNYGDLQASMFNEILAVIEENGYLSFIEERRKPLKIINKLNGSKIHFQGVGGSDLSRTKGLKPLKKVSLIVFDETQQLPSQNNLDQAMATFRRHLDDDNSKVVFAFNPEPQNAHWCNEFYRINDDDFYDDYLCLYPSYRDIADVLSDKDKIAIEREKVINPNNYRYLYLGETTGLFG